MNQRAKYLDQRSFRSKVIVTHRHTLTQTDIPSPNWTLCLDD